MANYIELLVRSNFINVLNEILSSDCIINTILEFSTRRRIATHADKLSQIKLFQKVNFLANFVKLLYNGLRYKIMKNLCDLLNIGLKYYRYIIRIIYFQLFSIKVENTTATRVLYISANTSMTVTWIKERIFNLIKAQGTSIDSVGPTQDEKGVLTTYS